MSKVLILYTGWHGQTERIAERLAARLDERGAETTVIDGRDGEAAGKIDLTGFAAAVLASSVHLGKHHPAMIRFIRAHKTELDGMHTVFVSVSNSQAGVEDRARSEAQHAGAVSSVRGILAHFARQTGWTPGRMVPVAGALRYSRYGALVRWVMKRIARASGAPTDTARDYEFTDWAAVDRLAAEIS